jgi:predicted nucleic acid-binding protein
VKSIIGYTLDSNVISELVDRASPKAKQIEKRMRDSILSDTPVTLNAVSYFEVCRGLIYMGATRKVSALDEITQDLGLLYLDKEEILRRASEFWAQLESSGRPSTEQARLDADVLMAAIASYHGYGVVTRNVRHFEQLPELRVENWIDE